MTNIEIIARGFGFPEGPVALADGSVVITEINGGRISRVAADGTVSLLGTPAGGPNGLALGPDGALYLSDNGGARYLPGHFAGMGPSADYTGGSIQRVDLQTGERRMLYSEVDGHRLSAPNDIVFDKQGGFYFTDLGKRHARHRGNGGLYYAQPDGSFVQEIAYPILSANGVGLSPDERTVYVADTEGARLWAFEVQSPGVLKPTVFPVHHSGRCIAGLPGSARFDSLAVTDSGNIVVATLGTGLLSVFAPDGALLDELKMPDSHPTNICFGGPEMRTAWVTLAAAGELARMTWGEPGLRLNFQQ